MVATSGSTDDSSSTLNKIPKLKGKDEFVTWTSDFEYILRIKELWDLVTGDEEVVEPFTEEELQDEELTDKKKKARTKEVKAYQKKVDTAWYIFRQALSPDYLSILELTPKGDAVQLWANLKSNFGQSNTTVNKLALLEKFSAVQMEGATSGNFRDSFNKACARIEKICSDLAAFDAPIQDEVKLGKLFNLVRGLNVEIDTFAANLIRVEDIDWPKAYNQLNDRFRELDISATPAAPKKKGKANSAEPSAESVANVVKDLKSFARKFKKSFNKGGKKDGSNGGGTGGRKFRKHQAQSSGTENQEESKGSKDNAGSGQKKKRDLKNIKCFRCNKMGHYQSDCPENNESNLAADRLDGDFDHSIGQIILLDCSQ